MNHESQDKTDTGNQYILQSVDNALAIIDLFCAHEELGALDVATLMGIGKSTAFRLLTTLERRGFLQKDRNARYRLGLKFYSIRSLLNTRGDLITTMRPFLTRLGELTGETCHLSILSNNTEVLFLDRVLGTANVRSNSAVGYTRPIYATSAGICMLACQPDETVRYYAEHCTFEKFTPNTISNVAELLEQVEFTRKSGYSRDREEFEIGLTCYGAAVKNSLGEPICALCTSGPTARMTENEEKCIAAVKEAAAAACEKFAGYHDD